MELAEYDSKEKLQEELFIVLFDGIDGVDGFYMGWSFPYFIRIFLFLSF